MTIIEITTLKNGAHANQKINDVTPADFPIPEGWAVVPEDMLPLEHFPFGEAAVDTVDGVPTVTGWTPLPIPEPEPEPEQTYTTEDALGVLIGKGVN